ncbi:hypothetical protein GIB67_022045, partial [Kingdonia uniflora]
KNTLSVIRNCCIHTPSTISTNTSSHPYANGLRFTTVSEGNQKHIHYLIKFFAFPNSKSMVSTPNVCSSVTTGLGANSRTLHSPL